MNSQDFISSLRNVEDAFNGPPKIDYLIEDLIPRGTLTIMAGDAGGGKTYTALAILIYLAAGLNFLGLPTEQVPALMIDEEMGHKMLGLRIVEIVKGCNTRTNIPFHWASMAGVDFSNKSLVKRWASNIEQAIITTGAEIVVIDALQDVIPGKNDSNSEDVTPLASELLRMSRALDVAFILIHHWNKQGGYRGSTAIKGMADALINLRKKGNYITLEFEKNRLGEKKNFTAIVNWDNGKFTITGANTSAKNQPGLTGCPQHTVEAMRAIGGGGTLEGIIQGIKDNKGKVYAKSTVKNAIQKLSNQGIVTRTDSGGKGVEATYMLRESVDPWYAAMNAKLNKVPQWW